MDKEMISKTGVQRAEIHKHTIEGVDKKKEFIFIFFSMCLPAILLFASIGVASATNYVPPDCYSFTIESAPDTPVSDLKGPYTGTEGVPLRFNGSGSYDSDGSIVAYKWDFGDGNNATGATPTHTYAQNGTYNVILTVTDSDGATDTSTTTATIADTEPTTAFSATPTSGQEPLTVAFTGNSVSYDGIVEWEWDFDNDGVADSAEQNPTYAYTENGVYSVCLTVTESDGDTDTMTKVEYITVTRVNRAPYAPDNPSPSDAATEVSIDEALSWTGGDPDYEDTVTYDVYFGTSINPPLVAENQLGTTYDPGTFDHSTEYYWLIVAKDNHGASTESEVWSFVTDPALEPDLVAEWDLDDGSGPTAVDTSGNGNDGSLVNNPAWVNGKVGKGLCFDGTNDYVDCGQDSSLKITGAITVEAWVNWQGAGNPYFVTKTGGPSQRSYDLSGNADGTVEFRVGGADCTTIKSSGTAPIPTDEWVYLVGTYEPSSYVRLFVNGARVKENTASIPASQGDNGLAWYIGAREGNQGWFKGTIDEVKIHNGALSAEEIMANYEAYPTNQPPIAIIESITPEPSEQGKDTVSFSGQGTDTDGSVVAYNWRSNIDGQLSTASSFSKPASELSAGTHTIYFNVQDDNAEWSTEVTEELTINVEPENLPPVADPKGPYTGTEWGAIAFDGNGSYDSDGSIGSYEWDFGDGNTATGVAPTHTYAQEGTYNVILTVTDNEGATDTNTTTATIADTEPTAAFSATPTSGQEPLTVAFSYNSESYDEIDTWEWDFDNDGEKDSTEQNPAYVYAENGVYSVCLTVTESDGDTDTMTKADYITVTRVNRAPYAPDNPSPSDAAREVSIDVALSWTGGDPDYDDTVTYDVYFGTSITPPLVAEHQSENTYDPGTFDHSTEYYWQIVARDDHGATTEGEVWAFTTAAAPDIPLIVSNPSATPDTILNVNDRPRIPGTHISQLSVTVTDDTEIDTVTIDLSPIGGSDEAQMYNIPGSDTWTFTTNAVEGINSAHDLIVTATGTNGNSDSSVSIQLTVLRRGDIDHDNDVDLEDAYAILEYLNGNASDPGVFIGDVYPATGDNVVDQLDVEYIWMYTSGSVDEP